jgi:hypothetical protein
MEKNSNLIYVSVGGGSKVQFQNPLINYWSINNGVKPKIIETGNLSGSPHEKMAYLRMGYKKLHDFFPDSALCRVITPNDYFPKMLKIYFKEHFHEEWEYTRDKAAPSHTHAWKFWKRNE